MLKSSDDEMTILAVTNLLKDGKENLIKFLHDNGEDPDPIRYNLSAWEDICIEFRIIERQKSDDYDITYMVADDYVVCISFCVCITTKHYYDNPKHRRDQGKTIYI